jgi:hypothetical protein
MKVLSIDVGVKNLSVCCMSKEPDNELLKINLWENYNLLEAEPVTCTALTKKKTICGKICKFKCNEIMSCKTHLPKDEPFKEIKSKLVDSYTLQQISLIVTKKITEIVKENEELFESLDLIQIEKQPKVNQKMQFVSHLVFGKLTELLEEKITKIRFVNASKKAVLFKTEESVITGVMKGAKGYSNRKKASIEYVTNFLQNGKVHESEYWLNRLESNTKKSDLADSASYCIVELLGTGNALKKKQKRFKKK